MFVEEWNGIYHSGEGEECTSQDEELHFRV